MSETSKDTPTLVAFAAHIATEFPELDGRAIAVSEVAPFKNKTNVPPLPMAIVALVGEVNDASGKGGAGTTNVIDDVLLQFMLKPVKYQDAQGNDTLFFAFYDYETLRNRVLDAIRDWRSPQNHGIAYKSLAVESDEFAVYVEVRLEITGRICTGASEGVPFNVKASVLAPKSVCQPCDTLPADCNLTPACDPPAANS